MNPAIRAGIEGTVGALTVQNIELQVRLEFTAQALATCQAELAQHQAANAEKQTS